MKTNILLSILFSMTAISCPDKELDFTIENNTNEPYYFTCFSNITEIKKILSHSQMDEQEVFKINKNINYLVLLEYSLYFYKKNENYVFY